MRLHRWLPCLVVLGCLASAPRVLADETPKAILLNVSKDQLPNDIGSDDKTTPVIVDDFKDMPGKVLKVAYAKGDSFGVKGGGVKNCKRYATLRMDVFNPSKDTITLELNVEHARTTSFQTRATMPFKLKPGKNEVKLGIDEMVNTNGSAPDMTNVRRFYLADMEGKAPTLYFSDIWLEGGEATTAPPIVPGGPPPLVGYKIQGKIGDMTVDLTITPFLVGGGGSSSGSGAKVGSDPARLERPKP